MSEREEEGGGWIWKMVGKIKQHSVSVYETTSYPDSSAQTLSMAYRLQMKFQSDDLGLASTTTWEKECNIFSYNKKILDFEIMLVWPLDALIFVFMP